MIQTTRGSLYDYPRYYDLLFGSDWRAEFDFLQACFARHARRPVRRIFEPACGTGRLMVKLAAAGYQVAGNDLNEKAIAYCNARLVRHGFPPAAVVGNMADFRVRPRVDAALNMINSFRHLDRESAALGHLECVAAALAPGGIYALALHLSPTQGQPLASENWSARRGVLAVSSRLRVKSVDLRRRRETVDMTLDVCTPTRSFRLIDELYFRTYTAAQMRRLIGRVAGLEIAATYDFAYQIDEPIQVDPRTQDVVYVLRKV